MALLRYIGRLADDFLDRLFSVAGALLFSQVPQFISQYMDTLSGALLESRRQVDSINQRAREVGMTLDSFIQHHLSSSDSAFIASGKIMQDSVERFQYYTTALEGLRGASLWQKPFIFLYHIDFDIIRSMKFHPGLPLTLEGALYGAAGIIVALLFYNLLLKWPFRALFGKRRIRKSDRAGDRSVLADPPSGDY